MPALELALFFPALALLAHPATRRLFAGAAAAVMALSASSAFADSAEAPAATTSFDPFTLALILRAAGPAIAWGVVLYLLWKAGRPFFFAGLTLLVGAFVASGAFAADAAPQAITVNVPVGHWLTDLLNWAQAGAVTFVTGYVGRYAPDYVKAWLTKDAIEKAVSFAVANVEGATADEVWTVPVTNDVARGAVNYLIVNEPRIASWAGSKLGPLILAQISALGVTPAASIAAPSVPMTHLD